MKDDYTGSPTDALRVLHEQNNSLVRQVTGVSAANAKVSPTTALCSVGEARARILDEAKQAVCKDRAKTHGDAEQSFELIAGYWSLHLGHPVSALDVPVMMNLFKCARARFNAGHEDNYTDMAGYAAIAGQMAGSAAKGHT